MMELEVQTIFRAHPGNDAISSANNNSAHPGNAAISSANKSPVHPGNAAIRACMSLGRWDKRWMIANSRPHTVGTL